MIQKMKSFAMDDVVEGELLKYLVQKKTEKPGATYKRSVRIRYTKKERSGRGICLEADGFARQELRAVAHSFAENVLGSSLLQEALLSCRLGVGVH